MGMTRSAAMKDVTLRPTTAGQPTAAGVVPAGPPAPVPAQPGTSTQPSLSRDAVTAQGSGPAADFAAADPSVSFADRPTTTPIPGSPEAALLQDMTTMPGLPPQWEQAFLQLPPADQRAMAQMYQHLSSQGRSSFLVDPPQVREAMSQMYSRMNPAQQAAFSQLTPGEQRMLAQLYAGMSGPAKASLLARPAADQRLMTQAFQQLEGPAQAAFLRLTPDQQVQFGRVWAEAGRCEFSRPATGSTAALAALAGGPGSSAAEVRGHLPHLLASGRLTETGTGGRTALATLDRLRTVALTLPPGSNDNIYRQQIFNTLVGELDDPAGIRQGNYNTCGATCAQRMFARSAPADYAAFVVGLVATDGRGTLPDGTTIRREADSLVPQRPDDSRDDRNQLERMVQAAFMEHASPIGYSNTHDSNTILGIPIAAGMQGNGIARLYSEIRHRPVEVLASGSWLTILDGGGMAGVSQANLMGGIDEQLQRYPTEAVPTEVHWNTNGGGSGDLHWIEVSRMTADRVYFLNPHGNSFRLPAGQTMASLPVDPTNGKHYIEAGGNDGNPRHRIYDDGSESVEQPWFERSLEGAVVDPDIRASARAAEPPMTSPI
jgi:hypothetical protein